MKDNYPIKPEHIDTTKHFWDTFSNFETETSARLLVSYAQSIGDWEDFAMGDITKYLGSEFSFNDLVDEFASDEYQYIKKSNGIYSFTNRFIAKCLAASPVGNIV